MAQRFPTAGFQFRRSHVADRSSGRTLWYALVLCLLAFALVIVASLSRTRPPQASRPAANPAGNPVSISETRSALGTYLTLTVVAESEPKARANIAAGFARIAELDASSSAMRSKPAAMSARASGSLPVTTVSVTYVPSMLRVSEMATGLPPDLRQA